MGTSGIALGFDGGGGRADDVVDMVVFDFLWEKKVPSNHGNVTA